MMPFILIRLKIKTNLIKLVLNTFIGVGHFSAMSLSVNKGGLHHFQDSLCFGVNMELVNVFFQDFTDCYVILSTSNCGLIIRRPTAARAD